MMSQSEERFSGTKPPATNASDSIGREKWRRRTDSERTTVWQDGGSGRRRGRDARDTAVKLVARQITREEKKQAQRRAEKG